MSQAHAEQAVTTPHVRLAWDAERRHHRYAVAVIQAAAQSQAVTADAAFDDRQLHIYGIEPRALHEGLCAVIAAAERRLVRVADLAEFLQDETAQLPEHLWARWNEAEAAIDFAWALRHTLARACPDVPVMTRSRYQPHPCMSQRHIEGEG